jgi:hypothetical protein
MIARRDKEYELQAILNDLLLLRKETKNLTYEITATEAHPVAVI